MTIIIHSFIIIHLRRYTYLNSYFSYLFDRLKCILIILF